MKTKLYRIERISERWERRFVAGGFIQHREIYQDSSSLPHACGGVSEELVAFVAQSRSSPRLWGCFPERKCETGLVAGLPHACGGVSINIKSDEMVALSSPRLWGCFLPD